MWTRINQPGGLIGNTLPKSAGDPVTVDILDQIDEGSSNPFAPMLLMVSLYAPGSYGSKQVHLISIQRFQTRGL